ncbi:SMAD/FHA domain-containing protein [Aspergillus multicolor]|uniref:putative FHA domain protein SNIP1 n=1 Tax=Aspergillus multicolor TaxID=41759 RepID=UPI003CCE52B9
MPPSEDEYSDCRRRRPSDSRSPDRDRDRDRRGHRHDDYNDSSSRKHHRSSGKDSPKRRSSRSPSYRTSHRRDYERRHPERSERAEDLDDDRRRRHRSPEERSLRRHHDHDRHRHRDRDREHSHRDRHSRRHRTRSRSRSPKKRSDSPPSRAPARSKTPLPSQQDAYSTEVTGEAPPPDKEKPNFGNTGRLAAESNAVTVGGDTVVLKYHEPPEARKPPAKESWRLYVFKDSDLLEMVELNERSCWLVGRERLVVDFPVDHPSCSKQHAAIQFRFVEKRNEFGDRIGKVKPYLIDLESANGSSVNGDPAPAGRYMELRDKDMLKFGNSSREYVLMLDTLKPDS